MEHVLRRICPENVDLKFVEPIATGLQGTPGEQGTFIQSGMQTDGIRPYRTYYYILAQSTPSATS